MRSLPTSLICEAISHPTHVVANHGPFRTTNNADILDRQNSEEEVPVGTIIPILVIHGRRGSRPGTTSQARWVEISVVSARVTQSERRKEERDHELIFWSVVAGAGVLSPAVCLGGGGCGVVWAARVSAVRDGAGREGKIGSA